MSERGYREKKANESLMCQGVGRAKGEGVAEWGDSQSVNNVI